MIINRSFSLLYVTFLIKEMETHACRHDPLATDISSVAAQLVIHARKSLLIQNLMIFAK